MIIVSGTPGTGKTTIAKKLAEKLCLSYIDVSQLIKKHSLAESYDRKRKTKIVDVKKLNKILIPLIKEDNNLIIDGHLSHYLPKKYVDLAIITKCSLKKLEKRLKKRNYSALKIRENLDAEIFDICNIEAEEQKHNILVVDTTKRVDIKELANKIKNLLKK